VSRFSEEMKIIPRAAWYIATILCVIVPIIACLFFAVAVQRSTPSGGPPFPFLFVGILICAAMFVYILILGYIAADAKRRGMRVVLWVLLAAFIPNAIGIILYFILREPFLRKCPSCGVSSGPYAFCPSCGASLGAACPSCRGAVEPGWSHCARCGASLRPA
jgi:hypothetical protein